MLLAIGCLTACASDDTGASDDAEPAVDCSSLDVADCEEPTFGCIQEEASRWNAELECACPMTPIVCWEEDAVRSGGAVCWLDETGSLWIYGATDEVPPIEGWEMVDCPEWSSICSDQCSEE